MARSEHTDLVYQLKITLDGIKPPVWRRVQVKDCSLATLHDLIQAVLGWTNSHLHVFEIGGQRYGEPDPMGELEFRDEAKTKLSQVVAAGVKTFAYTYDFGDNWDHTIL